MDTSDNQTYDWSKIIEPNLSNTMRFKKELFAYINTMVWDKYYRTRDKREYTTVFLAVLADFPEINQMFDNYYDLMTNHGEKVEDETIIMRFMKKLEIIYEAFEYQTSKVS